MKKVVSFSGGRTSAYLCYLMKEKYGDEVDFVYMDTGAEHPKTYEFIKKVNREFNLNLICLRGDFSLPIGAGVSYEVVSIDSIGPDLVPFKNMMVKYGVPYIGGMFCTDRMKLKPFKKYCDDRYGKKSYEAWLGIRADEAPRVFNPRLAKKLTERGVNNERVVCNLLNWINNSHIKAKTELMSTGISDIMGDLREAIERKKGVRYLAELDEASKESVLDFWSGMSFDLEIPEHIGNCVFCPKKSNLKIAAAQRDEPEFYLNWLDMIYSDSVRVDDKTGHWSKMYRGNQSLERLIATFDGSTGEEIKARMRGGKMTESGSCSESCEVFVCEANQIDIF